MLFLNLDKDGRVLSCCESSYEMEEMTLVDNIPDGDISDYEYKNKKYIYSPTEKPTIVEEVSQLDKIEAQVAYTAMMTDTLMGE